MMTCDVIISQNNHILSNVDLGSPKRHFDVPECFTLFNFDIGKIAT